MGRPVEPEHRLFTVGYSIEGGASGFSRYMELTRRPRAVFLACDEMAVGFVVAAQAHGLVAGKDYHVVGFDGHRLGRTLRGGALTTVEVPFAAMGQLTAEVAMRRIVNPRRPIQATYLGCHLFRGATLAPTLHGKIPAGQVGAPRKT
jgi:DNA-binding LacI/PurR family transcriptional regulator